MNHPEHTLQVQCVNWFKAQYAWLAPIFYAVPNGGYRNATTAAIMKAEGQKRGISDLCLDLPAGGKHGLRIEMKAERNGRQSDEQKLYEAYCAISGYHYVVCRTVDEFVKEVNDWMSKVDYDMMVDMKKLYAVSEEARISIEKAKVEKKVRRASSGATGKKKASSVESARAEMQSFLGRAMRTAGEVKDPQLRRLINY